MSGKGKPKGISASTAQKVISGFMLEYNGPKVDIVIRESKKSAFGPDEAKRLQEDRVKGAYYGKSGKVLVILDQIDNEADLLSTLQHEILAHHGLNTFKPADKLVVIDLIKASRTSKSVQKIWRKIDKEYADASEDIKAEEVLAYLAQNKPSRISKLWNDLLLLIRKGLRNIGLIGNNYGRPELIALVEEIADRVRRREPQQTHPESDSAQFSETGPAPVFYSQMQRTLAEKLNPKGNAKTYKQQIRAFVKKGQFKQEELEWSGVEEWLDSMLGKKITKDQVLEFLRANEIQVHEVEKGNNPALDRNIGVSENEDGTWSVWDDDELIHESIDTRETAETLADQYRLEEPGETETKFSDYQLPGGKNYRELLLTLPVKPANITIKRVGDNFQVVNDKVDVLATTANKEFAEQVAEEQTHIQPSGAFKSGHYDEPNILAHVRFNERTDTDGKRVLFIEEVQSDWHQEGRKDGYIGVGKTGLPPGYKIKVNSKEHGTYIVIDPSGDIVSGSLSKSVEEAEIIANRHADGISLKGAVPNAPFKTTWPMLAMKRMIRYAAENGFDRIAWTTGEQQADRYDLSKQVDGIQWTVIDGENFKDGEKRYQIQVVVDGRLSPVFNGERVKHLPANQLENYIGKDAAKKIIESKATDGELVGDDLKIGGEGMKGFYDNMLPKMVNKYVKKWGGKVGKTVLKLTDMPDSEYSKYPDDHPYVRKNRPTIHALDITPAMRDAAMQGEQPLFSKSRITGTQAQEAAIAATIDTPVNEIPWRQRIKDTIQRFRDIDGTELRQGFIDEFASIEALEKGVYGKVVDARVSPSKAARRTKNLDSVMAAMMLKGPLEYVDGAFQVKEGGKGFTEIFDNLSRKGLIHLWEGWAAANRANRLMKEGREHNFTQAQIDELLKLEDQYPEFRTALNEYQAFNKGVLDMAEKVGVIDGEARKLWEQNDYVPFYRAMEDVLNGEVQTKGPGNTRGLSGQKSGIKTLKGGEAKIGSVIENMVMNAAHLVDASFKTVALRRVVNLAKDSVMEKVEPGFQPVGIDAGQIVTTLRKAGIIPSAKVARQIAKETGVNVGAPLSASERKQYLNMFRRVAPAGNDIISVMNNGKPEYYRVTDPLLLRSLTSMGVRNVQGMMKLMRGSKRLLTAMVTADPAFMVANFIRDTLSTAVVSHVGLKPGVDAVKGFAAALKEDPALLAIMAAGGGGGGYYHSTPAETRANLHHHLNEIRDKRFRETVLDSPKKLWRAWQKVGAASENANRIAIFKAVKGKGGSTAEAVHQAQDILNFTQTGDFAAMRFLIETVPFMNARVQGLDRLYRGAKEDPRGFALKGMMITGATLALLASNWDDDEYDELPEWDRDIYWHFFLGEKDKDGRSEYHFRLPKPFEVGAIFGTIPERFARGAAGKDDTKILVKATGRMLGETFAMNPIPQLFKPVVEQYSNKTFFTGAPIIGMSLQRLKPEAQYDPWTSESMRGMAEAMPNWAPEWLRSPKRLETALRGYLGTIGMYAIETSDKLVREIGDYPDHPALNVDDIPVAKRFVRGSPPRSTKYTGQFYDMVRDANEVYSTVKRYRQQGRVEKAENLAAENAGKLRARKALNRMARRLTGINNRIKRVYSDRDMTRQEKRDAVDKLTVQKQNLVRQAARFASAF
ncbi:MAG TPA: hypothetical protein ENK38_05160 [Gammaproteobacteria bacterium]|nr:hypothetical protein [Gammaproteobacteria bacterium]